MTKSAASNVKVGERVMVQADRKSADEIEADLKAGKAPSQEQLIVDLWQRVDDLHAKVVELERRLLRQGTN